MSEETDSRFQQLAVGPLRVALAVHVLDGLRGGAPTVTPTVELASVDAQPTYKTDQLVVFLDAKLPTPSEPVKITVRAGDSYQSVSEHVIVTDEPDQVSDPSVRVRLPSNPSVSIRLFPSETTVIRAYVYQDEDLLSGITVKAEENDGQPWGETTTDSEGRFVLTLPDSFTGTELTLKISGGRLGEEEIAEAVPVIAQDTSSGAIEIVSDGDESLIAEWSGD